MAAITAEAKDSNHPIHAQAQTALRYSDEHRMKRFMQEAKVTSSRNTYYLALEHVDGPTVGARLLTGPIPTLELKELAVQATGALHRDRKPDNLMIERRSPLQAGRSAHVLCLWDQKNLESAGVHQVHSRRNERDRPAPPYIEFSGVSCLRQRRELLFEQFFVRPAATDLIGRSGASGGLIGILTVWRVKF